MMRTAVVCVTPPPRLTPAGTGTLRALRLAAAALLLAGCAAQTAGPAATGAASPAHAGAAARPVDMTQPVPVALLLPLGSADSAAQAIARDMEDAARLALDSVPGGSALRLSVHDTGGSGPGAAAAAERAVAEGAALLLGPTFAEEATSIAPVAARSGVPALSFSSLASAARPPVYILGFTPENDVARMLAYAGSQGLRRLALLHPRTPYGEVARAAVVAEAPRHGIAVVGSTAYDRNFASVQAVIGEAAAGIAASAPDAVLVADSGQALVAVMSFLALADLTPASRQFLGLKAWEEGRALRDPSLAGAWYPSVDPAAREAFEARFSARHGRTPHPLAAIAYDAVSAAGALVEQGRRAGGASPFAAQAIASPAGFEGATGRFRLGPDGRVERDLAIMEAAPGGPVLRAPAAPAGS